MSKEPAGTITISGHPSQSRKAFPGLVSLRTGSAGVAADGAGVWVDATGDLAAGAGPGDGAGGGAAAGPAPAGGDAPKLNSSERGEAAHGTCWLLDARETATRVRLKTASAVKPGTR